MKGKSISRGTRNRVGLKGPTLYSLFYNHINALIPILHLKEQRDLIFKLYETITKESLNMQPGNILPKFSKINNDGIPFQFSVSLGKSQGGLRFLSEAGVPGTSIAERVNLSCQKIGDILRILRLQDACQSINTALSILFPKDPSVLGSGGIWMALGFVPKRKPGFKMYVNAMWGSIEDNWYRFAYLLTRFKRVNALRTFRRLLPVLALGSVPVGIAMDVSDDGLGRMKIYLRSFNCETSYIEQILYEAGSNKYIDEFRRFAKNLLSEVDRFPPRSLVPSLEFFSKDRPNEVAVKIDACGHCLFSNDIEAKNSCMKEIQDLDFDSTDYETVLAELCRGKLSPTKNEHHAFFGLGLSLSEDLRFNIYLKPSISPVIGLRTKISKTSQILVERLDAAIEKSVNYILSQQQDGKWLEFELPVGKSDAWITGYVGYSLVNIRTSVGTLRFEPSLSRAAKWCIKNMNQDGGWRYNERCNTDADSTAYVILFLASVDQAVQNKSYEKLLSFQKENGGFSTYQIEDPLDSWGIDHLDVTPVSLMALLTKFNRNDERILRGERYVLSRRNEKGYWDSFWWSSPIYSTYVNISFLKRIESQWDSAKTLAFLRHEFKIKNAFEIGLLADCIMALRCRAEDPKLIELVKWLLANQQEDGSWLDAPILRLTYSSSAKPWTIKDSGKLFADRNRLFVTATVLRCLSAYRDLLTASLKDK